MASISDKTKQKIDEWIKRSGRNQYGDSKDTVYAGGNPLFDERSAKLKDRYEHILDKHPELKEEEAGDDAKKKTMHAGGNPSFDERKPGG